MDPVNHMTELPAPHDHLLLPKAHVHFFGQIVLLVFGILFTVVGGLLLAFGSDSISLDSLGLSVTSKETIEVLFYLGSSALLGIGVTCVILWVLWKYTRQHRIRFGVSIVVSTLAMASAMLSVTKESEISASQFSFYFFGLTVGLLLGLSALSFFFLGLSRHMFLPPSSTKPPTTGGK